MRRILSEIVFWTVGVVRAHIYGVLVPSVATTTIPSGEDILSLERTAPVALVLA